MKYEYGACKMIWVRPTSSEENSSWYHFVYNKSGIALWAGREMLW
jgi:hypothetical protein